MIQDYSYRPAAHRPRRRARWLVLAAAAALAATAGVSLLLRSGGTQARVPQPVPLKVPRALLEDAARDVAELPAPAPRQEWTTVEVRKGDTLSTLFDSLGLPPADWISLLKAGDGVERLRRLRVGDRFEVSMTDGRLQALRMELDETRTLHVARSADGFSSRIEQVPVEVRTAFATGRIESSLFEDGARAGLSDALIMEMSHIFGYDVDWVLDIPRGDRFIVVYEQIWRDGARLRDGRILAAQFENQGRVLRAVQHVDREGNRNYYAPDGSSLKKAFIRTPLDVFRISSHFNPRRRHPILNTIRAHKGTDYAAPAGTPIRATGDGRIVFRGVKGGYGRTVIIQHGTRYRTLYAHMSRFASGQSVGSRVRQGQVIGYVGASGLATAPHLHYEFLVDGVHRNPVSVPLPRAEPIPASERARFQASIGPLLAQLDALSEIQLAENR